VLDLALLPRKECGLLGKFRRTLLFEGGVVAAIRVRHAVLEVDDAIGHSIEKLAVMRDQQQRPRIIAQPGFQPKDRVEVQVIGRLIEQQQIRAAHERLRHIQPHAPAAGEFPHHARFIIRCEAESVHEAPRTTARVIAARRRVTRIQLSQPDARIAGVCVGGCAFDGALNGAKFRIAVDDKLDRCAFARDEFLRDVRNGKLRRHLEGSRIRLQLAAHQAQQTRFAAAVLAGDRHLLAAKQTESRTREQQPRTAAYCDVVEIEHARESRSRSSGRRRRSSRPSRSRPRT